MLDPRTRDNAEAAADAVIDRREEIVETARTSASEIIGKARSERSRLSGKLRDLLSEVDANQAPQPSSSPPSEIEQLLNRLAGRCEENQAQIKRMAERTVEALREDGGIETTRLQQLREADAATAGPHPSTCSEVFATLIVMQLQK